MGDKQCKRTSENYGTLKKEEGMSRERKATGSGFGN